MDGILVIDKPCGPSSHDVVQEVKRLFRARKVGHLGTLDPSATGVLPLAINGATKIAPRFARAHKVYEFDLILGAATDTDDECGKIIKSAPVTGEILQSLENIVSQYTGELLQVPPAYSAVKVKGVPLYKKARQGEVFDREPRRVRIDKLFLCDGSPVKPPAAGGEGTVRLRMHLECSSGTYVRALCRDIGEKLGCFGHAGAIRRLKSGPFAIEDAIELAKLRELTPEAGSKLIKSPSFWVQEPL